MKRLFTAALMALSLTCFAQEKTPAQLKQENAALRFRLANIEAQSAYEAREKAKKELEAVYPGLHWDERTQQLVENAPAKAEIDKKAAK